MKKTPFQKLVSNSFLFRLYLLKSLPMAFIAGVRIKELTNEKSVVSIKYKWLTQNPFHSMYFACEAMAAEMSTAMLVLNCVYKSSPQVSMLIIKNEALFHKKAIGKINFICEDGKNIFETTKKIKESTEAFLLDIKAIGTDEMGDKVAEFIFTWSLKSK